MDKDELYFQSASWTRVALSKDETNAEANFLMAKLYEEGCSVDRNLHLAISYYNKAGASGYIKGYTKIGHLYYSGMVQNENEVI